MPFARLLGERLLTTGGKVVATHEALKGASVVGLYFSASWCPPCRGFTPMLAESFTKHLQPKGFRCVLISGDRSAQDFQDYFAPMPWLALPYEDRNRQSELSAKYGVKSIPTLALLDEAGATITTEARDELPDDPEGKNFPWRPPLVRDLALGKTGRLNELPSVVCLCESVADAAAQHQALKDLTEVASAWQPARGPEGAYGYFVASAGPLAARIRELCGLPADGSPRLLLLDIPDEGAYYLGPEGEEALSPEAMRGLLQAYEVRKLERRQFK